MILTRDLPDDQAAEYSFAQDHQGSNPSCMLRIRKEVLRSAHQFVHVVESDSRTLASRDQTTSVLVMSSRHSVATFTSWADSQV